jgi:hypothetical protein
MLVMGEKTTRGLPLLLGLLWLGSGIASATTFLTLQSTFLGNGWFQYQMTVMNDPFFTEADITGFEIITFTNQIDQINGTQGWAYTGITNGWAFTNGYPARPYVETFLVRSSETSYRLSSGTNLDGAFVLLSLVLTEMYPGVAEGVVSGNIVGYVLMPCLVPCSPEEADGSPTNFVYTLKLLPDVIINSLIQTNSQIYGVDFTWDSESTFLLQGTADFNVWTNIAYVWSYPPETLWTTNTPLNAYGSFFRVALVADGHSTNLPPLTSSLALTPKTVAQGSLTLTTPRVTGCQFARGKVVVNLATQPGQTVQVKAVDSHGTIRQTQPVVAAGASATVSFDAASLPSPVFFRAVAVP